jgi:hypothetical protein
MAQMDYACGVTTAQVVVGATTVLGITGGAYCNGFILNLLSGGTVSIVGISSLAAKGYVMGTVPVMLGGPISFYLQETAGVTSTVAILKTLTGGFAG